MLELSPSVKRKAWRNTVASDVEGEFAAARGQVFKRDQHQCQFCGFSSKAATINFLNDEHDDTRLENLATACPLCNAVANLAPLAANKHGAIIHLPELSQQDLNHLLRTIAVVVATGSPIERDMANQLGKHLLQRTRPVKIAWGTASLKEFAQALFSLPRTTYDLRSVFMQALRIVVSPDHFASYLSVWRKEVYNSLPVSSWRQATAQWEKAIARERAAPPVVLTAETGGDISSE